MCERVPLPVAAEEIGCHVEYLRQQMKCGNWDLGAVIKPGRGKKYYNYLIFRSKLDRFLGKEHEFETIRRTGSEEKGN